MPPPGYPPNFSSQGPGGYALPPATRTSAAAIVSLVCGLILCVPFVTGLVALITGIVGISATSNPAVKGRGMAIAGIILGLISVGLWGLAGYGGYAIFQKSAPDRMLAQSYMTDLAAGRLDQCEQSSTSKLTHQALQNDYAQLKTWGTFQVATAFPTAWNFANNGKSAVSLTGVCRFSGGQHRFMITVVDDSGTRKVDSLQWLP
jgi:hypothetical protein